MGREKGRGTRYVGSVLGARSLDGHHSIRSGQGYTTAIILAETPAILLSARPWTISTNADTEDVFDDGSCCTPQTDAPRAAR